MPGIGNSGADIPVSSACQLRSVPAKSLSPRIHDLTAVRKGLAKCRQLENGRSPLKRRIAVVAKMLKRIVACVALAASILAMPGCGVKQSEYDAKVAEVKSHEEKAAKVAEKLSQLQKDLDSAKNDIDKARQARKKDAEARTKKLEQDNAELQKKASAKPLDFLKKK
jgi:septal ring factor EnvC (AmiA/AmiB activator)